MPSTNHPCVTASKDAPIHFVSDEEFLATWERHIRTLAKSFRLSYGMTDVEDMRQELRIKLLGIAQESRPYPQLVKTILHNRARTLWKAWMRRGGRLTRVDVNDAAHHPRLATSGQHEAVEQSHLVATLLASLTEQQRTIVTAYLGFGDAPAIRDLRRIAKMVGISAAEAQAELADAMARMRGMVDADQTAAAA